MTNPNLSNPSANIRRQRRCCKDGALQVGVLMLRGCRLPGGSGCSWLVRLRGGGRRILWRHRQAARLRQSPAELKEEGNQRNKKRQKRLLKGRGDRGRTERQWGQTCVVSTPQRDMEGSTEEDHKEKLLWNVKREVGAVCVCRAAHDI